MIITPISHKTGPPVGKANKSPIKPVQGHSGNFFTAGINCVK